MDDLFSCRYKGRLAKNPWRDGLIRRKMPIRQQVLYMKHPDDIVRIFLVNREAGMAVFERQINNGLNTHIRADRQHFSPWDHDLPDHGIFEFKDTLNHIPLFRGKESLFFPLVDQLLEVSFYNG